MAALPGLPMLPFLVLGGGAGAIGWKMRQTENRLPRDSAKEAKPAANKDHPEALLRVEPLAIEVGLGLVGLVEGAQESPLLRRISAIRKQLAGDLGYLLPPVRVTDNLSLRSREYVISMKGVEVARYELPQGWELAIPGAQIDHALDGQPTREPAFGIGAFWIPLERAERARQSGYTVVDGVSVLGTHLSELIRRHAYELFSRQDAKRLLDRVAIDNPKVVEDLVPKVLPLAAVQRVLQNLLRERVSIRDAVSILEALGEAGGATRNTILLTEYARQTIRRSVVKPYLNRAGELPAWFLDPAIEQAVEAAVEHGEQTSHLTLAPQAVRDILNRIGARVMTPETRGCGDHLHRRPRLPTADHRAHHSQPLLPGAQRNSTRSSRAIARKYFVGPPYRETSRSADLPHDRRVSAPAGRGAFDEDQVLFRRRRGRRHGAGAPGTGARSDAGE